MQVAFEIGQGEIRRVERSEHPLSLRRGLAETPCLMLLVTHDGLTEEIRQRSEIVAAAVDELALSRVGNGHANIALAESIRLEVPSADPLQVVATKPQPATLRVRIK